MANEIYSSSWWGEGVCTNSIDWGSSYKALANCTPTPDPFNNTYSLSMDGVDDYVNSGASTLSGETALSISAWVYPTAYGDATAPSFVSTDAASPRAFYLGLFNGTNFRFSLSTNGTSLTSLDTASSTVTLNAWQHILVTWDQINLKLYKNGVLLKTVATTSSSNGTFTTTNDLLIGARRSSAGFFEGNIDEVAVFNSVVDIADVWDGTGEATDLSSISGLVNWYRNGDNGTWKSPQWLIPNNENKTKFSNYSFEYDGVDDTITLGSPMTTSGTDWSFSCWIKTTQTGGNKIILSGSSGSGTSKYFGLNWNKLVFYSSDNTFDITSVLSVNDGIWHNIVFTYNYTSGAWTLYIDGSVDTSQTATIGIDIPSWDTFSARLGTSFYLGNIDECSYFNSIVNASTIYNSGVPNDLSSLSPVGYWRSEQSNFTDNWLVDNSALSNYSTRSFNFDGINDYIDTGANSLIGASTLTISAWFKSSDVDFQYLLGDNSIRIYIKQSNGDTRISFTGSVDPFRGFGVPYSVGNWNNIILTFDGSLVQADRLKLYHNGVEINNINAGTPNTTLLLNTAASFMIGRAGSTSSNPWNGNIDEVAYWNSVQDATTIYNSGEPARIDGAVSHWRMGEDATFNTNWNVPDNAGSNTGTSANMTIADLEGEASNYTGGGLSANMTIEDRVGDASNSSNNAVSFNQVEADRKTDVPT